MNNYESSLIDTIVFQNGPLFFDSKYILYIKNKIRESFVCYLDDDSTYFISRNFIHSNPINFNYGENFSKIFSAYVEKNSYSKKEKLKTKIEKTPNLFDSEFFNQFNIYKINNENEKLSLLETQQDKDYFFKNYASDIINDMYEQSNNIEQ
jgi:hypothetical protein